MFRFIHTGDWQMGMMAPGFGSAAERLREARIEALEHVLALAREHKADAILVAGDAFEDNQVDAAVVERIANLLGDKSPAPVYMLPGNHDPYTRDSVYRRPVWGQLGDRVHVLLRQERVELAEGVWLYPCPLEHKNGYDDPTSWIPARAEHEHLRVGLAHGTLPLFEGIAEDDHPIGLNSVENHDLDYLALGHWHSTLAYPDASDARLWYSGTHEPTRFGERESGHALVVTLEPSAPPQVEKAATGVLKWAQTEIDLDRESLDEAMTRLREWREAERTLVRMNLKGQVDGSGDSSVPDLLTLLAERFLYYTVDDSALRPPSFDADFSHVLGSPYLRKTVETLQQRAAEGVGEEAKVAQRALTMLQSIAWECRE